MLVEQGILPVIEGGQPIYDFAAALNHVRSVAHVPLPPGVREVIQDRLAQNSKEQSALLLAAAVLGRTCTFERLCQVANLPETEALEALEALLDGRLLTERPSDRQPYTVAHDYIREVVYTESREARRRVFHRRALLVLETDNAPVAECAFHALASLLDEPAFRYSVAAGSEAFASYAVQEALAHFDAARVVAQQMQAVGEVADEELLASLPFDAVWSFTIIDIVLGYGELNLALNQPASLFAGLEDRVRPYREAGFLYYLADEYWLRGRAAMA